MACTDGIKYKMKHYSAKENPTFVSNDCFYINLWYAENSTIQKIILFMKKY